MSFSLKKLDFGKANQQLKMDITAKIFQNSSSKQLRLNKQGENKENQNLNTKSFLRDSQTHIQGSLKLMQILHNRLKGYFKELSNIQCSLVYSRQGFFDEIDSVGCCSEISYFDQQSQVESMVRLSQADAFKISFANMDFGKKKNFTHSAFNQFNMVIQNIKNRRRYMALQQLRVHVLEKSLSNISEKLTQIKKDQLKKIIISKIKGDEIVMKVYLQFWGLQCYKIKEMEKKLSKLNIVHNYKKRIFKIFKKSAKKQQGLKILRQTLLYKMTLNWKTMKKQIKLRKVANQLDSIFKRAKKYALTKIKTKKQKSPQIFTTLQIIFQQRKQKILKSLQLHSLRKKRQLKSTNIGLDGLSKILNIISYRYSFKKLQNKGLKKKFVVQSKLLLTILNNLRLKQLRVSYFKLLF